MLALVELVLAIVALVGAAVALGLALEGRRALARTRAEAAGLAEEVAATRRELAEVRATAEGPPPPPLPRARSTALDDLREQLRAAQREAAQPDDGDEVGG